MIESKVYLDEFNQIYITTKDGELSGKDARRYISNYLDQTATKILDDIEDKKLVLLYEDAIIDIKDYKTVFEYYPELFKNIRSARFMVKNTVGESSIKRKVSRKNKYLKNKIMAMGIAAVILFNGAKFVLAEAKALNPDDDHINDDDYTTEEEYEEIDENNDINIEDFVNRVEKTREEVGITTIDEEGNIYYDLYGDENNIPEGQVLYEDPETNEESDLVDESEIETQQPNQEEKTNNIVSKILEGINQNINNVVLDYEDRSETEKAIETRENYSEIIHYYADMYGLDGDLMLAIATQEKGFHEAKMDEGGGTGIMQIQDVHDGETLTAYNYYTEQWEEQYVTLESMKDLDNNIKYGCMIYQNYLRMFNDNPIAATQAYNMGPGTVSNFYDRYCADTGKDKFEVISNPYDIGWMNYINEDRGGDANYLVNVFSYRGNDFDISYRGEYDGNWYTVTVSNNKTKSANVL